MKKTMILFIALLGVGAATHAQCPTKVIFTINQIENLDSSLTAVSTKDVNATFEVSPTTITINKDADDPDSFSGTVIKATCNWAEPYKNGKIIITCSLHDSHEDIKEATITIEAKNGKITILMQAPEHANDPLRLLVDKYEAKQ